MSKREGFCLGLFEYRSLNVDGFPLGLCVSPHLWRCSLSGRQMWQPAWATGHQGNTVVWQTWAHQWTHLGHTQKENWNMFQIQSKINLVVLKWKQKHTHKCVISVCGHLKTTHSHTHIVIIVANTICMNHEFCVVFFGIAMMPNVQERHKSSILVDQFNTFWLIYRL